MAAYTVQNGSTPRKLAALFSSFIFGLPDDLGFEETYALFLCYTHATEHLLLAFIRDQKEAAAGTSIAKKLEDFISSASARPLAQLCPAQPLRGAGAMNPTPS